MAGALAHPLVEAFVAHRPLLRRGTSEVGPYQSPMEDGMRHFHEWYRLAMEMAVGA